MRTMFNMKSRNIKGRTWFWVQIIIILVGLIAGIITIKLYLFPQKEGGEHKNGKDSIIEVPKLVLIEAGGFDMGINSIEEKNILEEYPYHKNEINSEFPKQQIKLDSFYISKYEISNSEYRTFLDSTGYSEPLYWNDERFNNPNQPVVGISWYDAMAYCNWLSEITNKRFRLPTEAEWEKAAKGNIDRKYPWGNSPISKEKAKYSSPYESPSLIWSFPNGVNQDTKTFNMAGNVSEWCFDNYSENFYKIIDSLSLFTNPLNLEWGVNKVIRGGSFKDNPFYLRCTARNYYPPDTKKEFIGFRVVMEE